MNNDHETITKRVDRSTDLLAIVAVGIAALVLMLHVLTHIPLFDESIHLRYLWLFSRGIMPNLDFFCIYPTLGYILTFPFIRIFPDSAFVVLGMRCSAVMIAALIGLIFYIHGRRSTNDGILALMTYLLIITAPRIGTFISEYSVDHIAALFAFGAMLLFFRTPEFSTVARASALCLFSIVIMPKYPWPLFFGMLGIISAYYFKSRRFVPVLCAVIMGSGAALAVIVLIFWLNNDSLIDNFRYAILANIRYTTALYNQVGTNPFFTRIMVFSSDFLRDNPLILIVLSLGVAGWIRKSWQQRDLATLGAGGILLGVLVSTLFFAVVCEQYITPVVLSLALFVPFTASLFTSALVFRGARLIFVIAVICILTLRMSSVAKEFHETPLRARGVTPDTQRMMGTIDMVRTGMHVLNDYDELLRIIPSNERVVAVWPFHPIFRRDVMFQIYDDRPSLSYSFSEHDPLWRTFDPALFSIELEKKPPALIVINGLDDYYPPGWRQVAEEFLGRKAGLYERYPLKMFDAYIRRDLLAKDDVD